jgi:hypothetical protein
MEARCLEKGAPVRGFVVISAKFSAVGCLMRVMAEDFSARRIMA